MRPGIMIERASKWMTWGGSCTAAGCGYAGGGAIGPIVTLSDLGLVVGIAVGIFGGVIQFLSWRDKVDTKRREDEFRDFELEMKRRQDERSAIEHQALLEGRIIERRAT